MAGLHRDNDWPVKINCIGFLRWVSFYGCHLGEASGITCARNSMCYSVFRKFECVAHLWNYSLLYMILQLLRQLRKNITCGFPRIPWGSPDPENPPSGGDSFGNPTRMLINCFGSNCCTLWTTCGQAPSVDWGSLWLFMTTAVCVTYRLGVFWNRVTEYQIGDDF